MCTQTSQFPHFTQSTESFSVHGGSSLRQKAQSSIYCSSWAVVSERGAFFPHYPCFSFWRKETSLFFCLFVRRFWFSSTGDCYQLSRGPWVWLSAVYTVSLLGAVWITSVTSAMATSPLLFRSSSCLLFWSSLLTWMKFASSLHYLQCRWFLQHWQCGYVHRQPLL